MSIQEISWLRLPYNEMTGVDEVSILGSLQVPRVPHHGAGPAAVRPGVCVEHVAGNELKKLLHHLVEVCRVLLQL